MTAVDAKRNVKATFFDWRAEGYPGSGEPGQAGKYVHDHLQFACPGCGLFGAIRCGHPKPGDSPSWDITAGNLDDVTTLSLSPSIHCLGCCGWHGHLIAGEFKSC